jgi:predicted metal-dependent hydrolase
MAAKIDRDVVKVNVRDTSSRWGSCTHGGRLSFCWRLILAPDHVLTYVIAHEVAHLKHMNHGRHFWRTVDELMAQEDIPHKSASARQWLRLHGASLYRYR